MTNSERLFDAYCEVERIACSTISERDGVKTADRRLNVGDKVIVVEVKELAYDPCGIEHHDDLVIDGITLRGRTFRAMSPSTVEIGKKARQKSLEGKQQIKASISDIGGLPYGLLVLYADRENHMDHHVNPGCIADAMYGDSKIMVTLVNGVPYRRLDKFKRSGRERMTPNQNTSISAVAVLSKRWPWPEEEHRAPECGYFLNLNVYHNKYATNPLPPSLLDNENTAHYEYNEGSGYWEPMGNVGAPTS